MSSSSTAEICDRPSQWPVRKRNWPDVADQDWCQRGDRRVTSIDAAPRLWLAQTTRQFTVECFGNGDLTAACWPSISAGPELQMHVYQSREFLDVWMATIGKARGADCFLIV